MYEYRKRKYPPSIHGFSSQTYKNIVTDAISSLIEKSVEMILLWRKRIPNAEEADCISQCNLQMATCTAQSILSLAKGIHWGYHSTFLIDVHSCASLVRALYERAFIFRNIYVSTDNVLERDLLLYIWEIRGLNNRVNLEKCYGIISPHPAL